MNRGNVRLPHLRNAVADAAAAAPDPAAPFIGSIQAMPAGEVDTKFHDRLEFHTCNGETRESWSYEAMFTDGQCVDIRCLEYERRN